MTALSRIQILFQKAFRAKSRYALTIMFSQRIYPYTLVPWYFLYSNAPFSNTNDVHMSNTIPREPGENKTPAFWFSPAGTFGHKNRHTERFVPHCCDDPRDSKFWRHPVFETPTCWFRDLKYMKIRRRPLVPKDLMENPDVTFNLYPFYLSIYTVWYNFII